MGCFSSKNKSSKLKIQSELEPKQANPGQIVPVNSEKSELITHQIHQGGTNQHIISSQSSQKAEIQKRSNINELNKISKLDERKQTLKKVLPTYEQTAERGQERVKKYMSKDSTRGNMTKHHKDSSPNLTRDQLKIVEIPISEHFKSKTH